VVKVFTGYKYYCSKAKVKISRVKEHRHKIHNAKSRDLQTLHIRIRIHIRLKHFDKTQSNNDKV